MPDYVNFFEFINIFHIPELAAYSSGLGNSSFPEGSTGRNPRATSPTIASL